MSEIPAQMLERQDLLFRANVERIEVAYLKSVRQGVHDPAVFVLDLTSDVAQQIMRAAGCEDEAQRHIDTARQRGVTPVNVTHLPAEAAARRLPPGFAKIADMVRRWAADGPGDCFPVIIVGPDVTSLEAWRKP